MIFRMSVPIPPSGNKMWRHSKKGIVYKTVEARFYQHEVGLRAKIEVQKQGWVMTKGQKVIMRLLYFWPDNRHRDTDNARKVLCDSLQGILYDNDRYILAHDIDWEVDRNNPRIEIELIPKGDIDEFKGF